SMGATERNDAHKLIEECMIAANVQAALFLEKKKIPALFRAHEPPPAEKYEDLQQFLREFKLRMPSIDEVTPADFSEILRMVHDRPERELIQNVLLRSQSMAAYQPDNRGHFGLALQAYAHFTSPIRRYPDLLVHRAIRFALSGRKVVDYTYTPAEMAAMAVHCSQRERRAEEAERDVDERFKCAWMEKHIGSEFNGVVTGVTSFGLFVELDESKVSGLVHISQLANDYYHFDATRKLLKGERTGAQFRLGDHVRVQVLRASLEDRKIDFRLVSPRAQSPSAPASGKPHDYAASGERYSLPKRASAPATTAGMFGRATKAIGRAFGRKQAEPVAQAPAPAPAPAPVARKATPNHRPASAPGSGKPSAGKGATAKQAGARKAKSPTSSQTPRKQDSKQRGSAAASAPAPKKHSRRRRSKPKGES
ncbi:MAG: RNB domain-containing ribonuclease, partial [Rhodanobacter sp.]